MKVSKSKYRHHKVSLTISIAGASYGFPCYHLSIGHPYNIPTAAPDNRHMLPNYHRLQADRSSGSGASSANDSTSGDCAQTAAQISPKDVS